MSYEPPLRHDYKERWEPPPRSGRSRASRVLRLPHLINRIPRMPAIILLSLAVGIGSLLTITWHDAEAKREPSSAAITAAPGDTLGRLNVNLDLPPPETLLGEAPREISAGADGWKSATIARGDSLSSLFSRLGLSPRQMHELLSAGGEANRLRRLMPGEELRVLVSDEGRLEELIYQTSRTESVHITRGDTGFEVRAIDTPVEVRTRHTWGTIGSSFYAAARDAGLSDNLIMGVADIFGWDIDFALDIRGGDRFSLLYEERYLDGEKIGDGAILAAEFTNRGRLVQAVRFVEEGGSATYYTPEGLSMRKAFLRTPVDFRRISSRFQTSRHHPVLGQRRPHRGVDYAAPPGTPIKAAGDGRITYRGNRGGYGLTVIIDHGRGYETLYAHMSSFRRGLQTGSRVSQGQIVGYVGMSGLATGPHLHYEFRLNGRHRDPLTVPLPNAEPIKANLKGEFTEHARGFIAQLDLYNRAVAAAQEEEL